ncbi:hypothetical protein E4U27_000758 [Claviceps purpurea]|nr:hypothetical protein E4U27_000758 [Claviceps purpurea]
MESSVIREHQAGSFRQINEGKDLSTVSLHHQGLGVQDISLQSPWRSSHSSARSITTLRTVSRRQTAADKPRSLTRVSASTKRRGAVIPFAQQAQSGARGAQI